MRKIRKESLGWLVAGILCILSGVAVIPAFPSKGEFYVLLGVVAIIISMVVVKVEKTYRKFFLKK